MISAARRQWISKETLYKTQTARQTTHCNVIESDLDSIALAINIRLGSVLHPNTDHSDVHKRQASVSKVADNSASDVCQAANENNNAPEERRWFENFEQNAPAAEALC